MNLKLQLGVSSLVVKVSKFLGSGVRRQELNIEMPVEDKIREKKVERHPKSISQDLVMVSNGFPTDICFWSHV